MKNLAGRSRDPNPDIRNELTRCGIPCIDVERSPGEVPYTIAGRLGAIELTRAWYYWVARGPVPLDVAKRLYAHPVGVTDIRVAGHCGCPPPEPPWLEFRTADGQKIAHDPTGEEERRWDSYSGEVRRLLDQSERPIFARDAFAIAASVFVDCYHIDSELGLYLFAEAVRGLESRTVTAATSQAGRA